jgi:hypothetical protein
MSGARVCEPAVGPPRDGRRTGAQHGSALVGVLDHAGLVERSNAPVKSLGITLLALRQRLRAANRQQGTDEETRRRMGLSVGAPTDQSRRDGPIPPPTMRGLILPPARFCSDRSRHDGPMPA